VGEGVEGGKQFILCGDEGRTCEDLQARKEGARSSGKAAELSWADSGHEGAGSVDRVCSISWTHAMTRFSSLHSFPVREDRRPRQS
jgi:hypothetical protein